MLMQRYRDELGTSRDTLDYGCGWGRVRRMLPYFTDLSCIYGVDPADEALQHYNTLGVSAQLEICDPIPSKSAFDGKKFDVVYSFSVFTHLSKEASTAVLSSIRNGIADDGLLVLTIRPVEFWDVVAPQYGAAKIEELKRVHLSDDYAFIPVNHVVFNGKNTFGETSFSFAQLDRIAAETG